MKPTSFDLAKFESSLMRPTTKRQLRQHFQRQVLSVHGVDQHSDGELVPNSACDPISPSESHAEYEIRGVLDEDELSVTHEAYDRTLRRLVAIRMLAPRHVHDDRKRTQFWQSARFEAAIHHEHILAIFGTDRHRDWVVTEAFDQSLSQLATNNGLPPAQVISIVTQTLAALSHLHKNGLVHGDVCPRTILFSKDGRVKLSRTPGISSEISLTPGRAKYRAPELLAPQLFGTVGPQVDLYSLGMTAIELLAGRRFVKFFRAVPNQDSQDDTWARWHCSVTERLPGVANLVSRLPGELAHVIDRMIEKRVEDRYPTAAEALADLVASPTRPAAVPQLDTQIMEPQSSRKCSDQHQGTELSLANENEMSVAIPASLLPNDSPRISYSIKTNRSDIDRIGRSIRSIRPTHLIMIATACLSLLMVLTSKTQTDTTVLVSRSKAGNEREEKRNLTNSDESPTIKGSLKEKEDTESRPQLLSRPPLEPVPPPKTTETPPPKTDKLYPVSIRTNPIRSAFLEIDGKFNMKSDSMIQLPPGQHEVVVRQEGFLATRQSFSIGPRSPGVVEVNLETRPPLARTRPKLPDSDVVRVARTRNAISEIERRHNRRIPLTKSQEDAWIESLEHQKDPRINHVLGLYFVRKRRFDRAINALANANQWSPDNYLLPLRRLVWCFAEQGQDDTALRHCELLLERASRLPDTDLLNETAYFVGQVAEGLQIAKQRPVLRSWEPQFKELLRTDELWQQYLFGQMYTRYKSHLTGSVRTRQFSDLVHEPLDLEMSLVWDSFP